MRRGLFLALWAAMWICLVGAIALMVGAGRARALGSQAGVLEQAPVWTLRACLDRPLDRGCLDLRALDDSGGARFLTWPQCRALAPELAGQIKGARIQCAVDGQQVEVLRRQGKLP